jgi:MazG family protein
MQEPSALGRIVELVRDLRQRCPWDSRQTPQTLRPYLVEEVLELDQAVSHGSPAEVKDELGDLLLHLAFQIVLAEEAGHFGAEDVTRAVESKMWRRHPHLFPAGGQEGQDDTWERGKLREHTDGSRSVLDGLPPTLPALLMAYRLQERAAGVGFDWPDAAGPLAKIKEELGEIEAELTRGSSDGRVGEEIGDLLFAVVNLARKLAIDPRPALEEANARFATRFRKVEELAAERGIDMGGAELDVLDELWNDVKREMGNVKRDG